MGCKEGIGCIEKPRDGMYREGFIEKTRGGMYSRNGKGRNL
jgi:hypothetical protein